MSDHPTAFQHTRPTPTSQQIFEYIREAWEATGIIHANTVPTSTEYAIAEHALGELLELRRRLKEGNA